MVIYYVVIYFSDDLHCSLLCVRSNVDLFLCRRLRCVSCTFLCNSALVFVDFSSDFDNIDACVHISVNCDLFTSVSRLERWLFCFCSPVPVKFTVSGRLGKQNEKGLNFAFRINFRMVFSLSVHSSLLISIDFSLNDD